MMMTTLLIKAEHEGLNFELIAIQNEYLENALGVK